MVVFNWVWVEWGVLFRVFDVFGSYVRRVLGVGVLKCIWMVVVVDFW